MKKLFGWLTGLDLTGKVGVGVLALIIAVIAVVTINHAIDAAFDGAEQKGAVTERAATQGKVLDHVAKAAEATDRYRNDAAARDADCLRDARNPEDC